MIQELNNSDFVNTSEAYSQTGFMVSNWLIIPYVNINLLPLSPLSDKACYIDYSYFVFKGLVEIVDDRGWQQVFLNERKEDARVKVDEDILVGSWKGRIGVQLNIKCVSAELYLGANYHIHNSRQFTPYDTPNFKQNMLSEHVEAFFKLENILRRFKDEF